MEKMGRNTTIIFIPFNTYMVKQAYRTRNPTLLFGGVGHMFRHAPSFSDKTTSQRSQNRLNPMYVYRLICRL